MAKTFVNCPVGHPARHEVKTERCHYTMSPYWIDIAHPSDMMDYDFTAAHHELLAQHAERHSIWCSAQADLPASGKA